MGPGFPGHSTNVNYVEKDCRHNPRVVVLPITDEHGNSANKRVVGFATVYITGCFEGSNQLDDADSANETNSCSNSGPSPEIPPPPSGCGSGGPSGSAFCEYEVRGIPVQTFIIDGAVGAIVTPTNNAPLTIQTTQ